MAQISLTTWSRDVYEPSEDSFALVDALQECLPDILRNGPPRIVLEVGCGSGYVICSAALALRAAANGGSQGGSSSHPARREEGGGGGAAGASSSSSKAGCGGSGGVGGKAGDPAKPGAGPGALGDSSFMAVDISAPALAATAATLAAHGVSGVDLVRSDLLGPLAGRLAGGVGLLLFNPPYVPTPDEEVQRDGIARAWAGGHRGRRVIDRLLPQLPLLLAPGGHCLMVTVQENEPEEIIRQLSAHGVTGSVVLQRGADEECLKILHLRKAAG